MPSPRAGTDDGEVEVLVLRYSVRLIAPGCMALVLESLTSRPPYVLENRTPHPLFFRQAAQPSLPYQELPPYAAAGFCWRLVSGSPQEVLQSPVALAVKDVGQDMVPGCYSRAAPCCIPDFWQHGSGHLRDIIMPRRGAFVRRLVMHACALTLHF